MERKMCARVFLGFALTLSFAAGGERHVHPRHKEVSHSRPYAFSYGIKDAYAGNDYERSEVSDGHHVTGSYTVQLPDGRKQIVKYAADHDKGFVADVSYYGQAKYPPPHKHGHGTKFHPHEIHNIKPILPKYKPKLTPHEIPIKPFHSEYVPSKPEFHIQRVPPHKPKLQNYGTSSKPLHYTPARPYKMPIKPIQTEYKPSVPQHEQYDKPSRPEYKPKRPHKPLKPVSDYHPDMSHKPMVTEFKPDLTHKPAISGYNPEIPFKPMYLDKPHKPIISDYQLENPFEPIISEHKPEKPHKPMHFGNEPDIAHKPIVSEYEPDTPHKLIISEYKPENIFMPMHLEYKPDILHKPIESEYKPDIPHKPIISEYKPEIPFKPMNLAYEPDIPHTPISTYKPDVPHQPTIPEYEHEIPHKETEPIFEDTIYSKVKAKRQKFPPYFPDKGPIKLPEISPLITLKDLPLENSNIEETHNFKQSNAHVNPIHNLASISIYTPIKTSPVPNMNFEGLDPSIIAEDIPIILGEHGNQPSFDSGPLFKGSLEANYESFSDSNFQHIEPNTGRRTPFPGDSKFAEKLSFSQEQTGLGPDFRSDYQETSKDPNLEYSDDKSDELKYLDLKLSNEENEPKTTVRERQQNAESDAQSDQLGVFNSKKIGVKKFVRPKGTTSGRINPDWRRPVVKRDMKSDFGEHSINN